MDISREVREVLTQVLGLGDSGAALTPDSPLLGVIPELDSMVVVTLITTLEERFGIAIDDGDIDGATFATVRSLIDFVRSKLDV